MAVEIAGLLFADWFFYSVVAVTAGVVVGGGYWFYYARVKIGYKAVFTRLMHGVEVNSGGKVLVVGGVRKVIGEKEVRLTAKEVKFRKGVGDKGEPFKLDFTKPAYQWFGWTRYYFDYDTGDCLTFGGIYQSLNPKDADMFMNDGLIRKAIDAINAHKTELIAIFVMFAVVAILMFVVGLMASPYILPQQVPSNITIINNGTAPLPTGGI